MAIDFSADNGFDQLFASDFTTRLYNSDVDDKGICHQGSNSLERSPGAVHVDGDHTQFS